MGRGKRTIPTCLPGKLALIRTQLGLNTEEMIGALENALEVNGDATLKIYRSHILEFESGKREPQLPILLAYGHLANIYVDILIDDNLHLPKILPAKNKPKI